MGWLVSSGEARGSWLEAVQLCGGGVCHVERQLDLKSLPLDCYVRVFALFASGTGASRTTASARRKEHLTTARQDGDRGAA